MQYSSGRSDQPYVVKVSLDSFPASKTNRQTVSRNHGRDIRRTSCCLRGYFRAVRCGLQVPCDCAFMWHFNYCCRFLLITLFSPTALGVLTPVTRCLLQRWKQTQVFFCSVNKCNCLLLFACPGGSASHFNANSIILCFNDRLNVISKTSEGTVSLAFGDFFCCLFSKFSDPIIFT